ncbi:hypothetical protein CEXT_223561 [Caerostris extrusa]|uniref:Uncharacterized protein n=1 Tax=Caerostris extrusa TaxID=172846 RepID=A0AAV4XX70_CAEEX|nr:hypothetical protein CEXT_223561 [Caerostris extrusa]
MKSKYHLRLSASEDQNPHDPISCSRCRRVNCTSGTIPKAQPSETEPSGCVRGGRLGSISRGKIGEPLAQVQAAVTPIWSGERKVTTPKGKEICKTGCLFDIRCGHLFGINRGPEAAKVISISPALYLSYPKGLNQFSIMKVIAIVLLMAGAAMAQYASHGGYHQPGAYAASSHGHANGAHGQHASGYAAHGNAHHADRGAYSDKAHAAHGHHNAGGHASHDAQGAQASHYGKYRNTGAYAHDKGTGYEKAYAYDKKAGHHAVTNDHGAHAAKYGVSDRSAHHNVGAHAQAAHDKHGSHDRYAAQAHGVRAHDSASHGQHGSGHQQMYFQGPGYGYKY